MALTAVRKLQLHKQVERVLHVPGNYQGGILEMAIVVDCACDKEAARGLCMDVITACKNQSEVFRNVRLNMVIWNGDKIHTENTAAARVQTGAFFEECDAWGWTDIPESVDANTAKIMEYLKKFHARSKLILFLTPNRERLYKAAQPERLRAALSPFLKQKLVMIYPEEMESGTEFFIKIL